MAAAREVLGEMGPQPTSIITTPRNESELYAHNMDLARPDKEEHETQAQQLPGEEKRGDNTHRDASQKETVEESSVPLLELRPAGASRADEPSPQLIDTDDTSASSASHSCAPSPLPGQASDAHREPAPQGTPEEHAWQLIEAGIADETRSTEVRRQCTLVFPPGHSSTYTYLHDRSLFAPLHDVARLCTSDVDEEHFGVLHAPPSGTIAVWILGDRVVYHSKGQNHLGILFGLTRNTRSHHTSAWVSAPGPEHHLKLPVEQLVARDGVATPAELRDAVCAAHAPVPTPAALSPAAPPPKRLAAMKADENFVSKKQRYVLPLPPPASANSLSAQSSLVARSQQGRRLAVVLARQQKCTHLQIHLQLSTLL